MDKAQFRLDFPEFANTATYPDSSLDFWAGVAEIQVVKNVWKTMYATGVKLYVAHEITLAAQNVRAASKGGAPGQSGGIANSKTVGSASIGFDSNTSTEKDAGWWNRTTYGMQFYRLMRLYGAGCIQL